MMLPDRFEKESDLCAAFIAAVNRDGKWTVYPETSGWDLLLVRKEDGFQIGVEAKLKFNVKVISQTLESYWLSAEMPGPDCRAVLVPPGNSGGDGLDLLCAFLGVTVLTLRELTPVWKKAGIISIYPPLPSIDYLPECTWRLWCPLQRERLPEYVPDVVAGASGPTKLTDWKIAAIKIAIITETRPVTRADFKALRIDHRRWITPGVEWLTPAEDGSGWVRSSRFPDFKGAHPINYEQIKADQSKWMPNVTTQPTMKQERML